MLNRPHHRQASPFRRLMTAAVAVCFACTIAVSVGCEETVIREETSPSAGFGAGSSFTARPSSYGSQEPSPHTVTHTAKPAEPDLIKETGRFLFGWVDDVFE